MRADPNLTPIVAEWRPRKEPATDRFLWWPTGAILALLLLGFVLPLVPKIDELLTGISLFASTVILALVTIGLSVFALSKRRFRRAICYAMPAIIFAVLTVEEYYFGAISTASDQWRFDLTHARYEAQLAPPNGEPRLQRFSWEAGGWDAPIELVFDESDEIALPQGRQSAGWLARTKSDAIYKCRFDSTHVDGHFYVVRFAC